MRRKMEINTYGRFRNIFHWLSVFALMTLVSLIFIICIPLVMLDRGVPHFPQKRVRRKTKVFRVTKLRKMVSKSEALTNSSERPVLSQVKIVGRSLRKSSIKEFPQLLNVIKANMSLFEQRPMLPRMVRYMTRQENELFIAQPHFRCFAQIIEKNYLEWTKRAKYDVDKVNEAMLQHLEPM